MFKKHKKKLLWSIFSILLIGFLIPQRFSMPVEGANHKSYHAKSFWYYPWGRSGTHKGVDIFAKEGTHVKASTSGWVIYAGNMALGGNVVLILSAKWRIHYYAHLKEIHTSGFSWVSRNEKIGSVGTTGNAQGKAPHLHYSITTLVPYIWRIDSSPQGWKKIFYLNPIDYLKPAK